MSESMYRCMATAQYPKAGTVQCDRPANHDGDHRHHVSEAFRYEWWKDDE